MPVKLTIGMAHHTDPDGVWFTVESLVAHHLRHIPNVEFEILVVDQSPDLPIASDRVKNVLANIENSGFARTKYVPMREPIGTSPSRNRIFAEARGEIVLVVDCHVLLQLGAIQELLFYYDSGLAGDNLIQGPLMMDDQKSFCTHFNDQWRSKMWGTMGQAWQCNCSPKANHFTMLDRVGTDKAWPVNLTSPQTPIDKCANCGKLIPVLDNVAHEVKLEMMGFVKRGVDKQDEPFEIPGQGMGLFACRREAWLGFCEHSREFGGEEMWIHEKFRRAGRKTICLPALPWNHKFRHPEEKIHYPISLWSNVRNYVVEFNELGMDLEPIRKHFVEEDRNFSIDDWNELISNPVKQESKPPCPTCNGGSANVVVREDDPRRSKTLEQLYEFAKNNPGDINEHCEKLRELSSRSETVVEFGVRYGISTTALLAGQPKRMISYDIHDDPIAHILKEKQGDTDFEFRKLDVLTCEPIPECDLLFIDTLHTADQLMAELIRHAPRVKRWIVLHDTQSFGEHGQDGKWGLLVAMRDYMFKNKQWSLVKHYKNNNGLTILSCNERDKPKLPNIGVKAKNFAMAMAKHAATGGGKVSEETYNRRLDICTLCEHRNDGACSLCGCVIEDKALIPTAACPIMKWGPEEKAQ